MRLSMPSPCSSAGILRFIKLPPAFPGCFFQLVTGVVLSVLAIIMTIPVTIACGFGVDLVDDSPDNRRARQLQALQRVADGTYPGLAGGDDENGGRRCVGQQERVRDPNDRRAGEGDEVEHLGPGREPGP